jgi:hypothetical protein
VRVRARVSGGTRAAAAVSKQAGRLPALAV